MPPGCIEPACCSHAGTASTVAFTLALVGLWAAVVLLLLALSLPDLFTYDVFHNGSALQLGVWRACGWNWWSFGNWVHSCKEYGGVIGVDVAWFGLGDTFNAMRALTVISATATLSAGVLSAIRLAAQQRSRSVSPALSWSLISVALLALTTATTAFTLSLVLYNNFPVYADLRYGWHFAPHRGGAWATLLAAWIALLIAVPLHILAHFHYQHDVAQRPSKLPDVSMAQYHADATACSHSPPLYFSQVQYATTALPHSALLQQPVMAPQHGYYDAEAPLAPVYATEVGEQATA